MRANGGMPAMRCARFTAAVFHPTSGMRKSFRWVFFAMHEPLSNAVRHDIAQNRFALDVDGETVFTEYRLTPGVITFFHTLTPPKLRGRGLAGTVVKAALDFARAEKLRVVPQCWYVGQYMDTHPEYQDLRAARGL